KAIVRWSPGEHDVRIDFREQTGDEPRWQSRSLSFGETDERIERWRTVGLTIASLAGTAARAATERRESERKKSEATDAQSSRSPSTNAASPSEQEPRVWMDIGALVGTALDTASPRLGVWADVGTRLGKTPLAAIGIVDYAVARGDPSLSVQWLGFSGGIGVELGAAERG